MSKLSVKDDCPWCKHNAHGCDRVNCDFKSLDFRKDAILERIKQESIHINDIKKKVMTGVTGEEAQALINQIMDIAAGVQIMSTVLQQEFKVSEDEIKKVFVKSDVSKIKLAFKLANLKKSRGGPHGSKKSK